MRKTKTPKQPDEDDEMNLSLGDDLAVDQRPLRKAAYADFLKPPEELDKSPYGWAELRRQAQHGMTDPSRNLRPYVTYIPDLIDKSEFAQKSMIPYVFNFGSKQSKATQLQPADTVIPEREEDIVEDEAVVGASLGLSKRKAILRIAPEKHAREFNEATAAQYIQKLYRARQGRNAVRKVLCKIWCKKNDSTPGIFYYQNVRTGETQWVPPRLMKRLFPTIRW